MKKQLVVTIAVILLALGVIAFVTVWNNETNKNHVSYEKSKWQNDVSARRDMLNALSIKPGMSDEQMRQLLGEPELESIDKSNKTTRVFCYRMPFSGQKAVYYIVVKNGLVTDTHVDDSGDVEYDEIEHNMKDAAKSSR
ncbi:MAG TPA: hypothetical protein V6C89_08465 [Drouetiella sp.]